MSSIWWAKPRTSRRRLRPVSQVRFQEAIAVGPTAAQPEEVIEQRQVLPGQLPGHAAALAQGVEIDHEELGRIVGREANHDVAGMKVLVEQPASCSRAVMTAMASASLWRICERSGSGRSGRWRSTNSSSGVADEIASVTR